MLSRGHPAGILDPEIFTERKHLKLAGELSSAQFLSGILTFLRRAFLCRLLVRDGGRREHLAAVRVHRLDVAFMTGFVADGETAELWRERVPVARLPRPLSGRSPALTCKSRFRVNAGNSRRVKNRSTGDRLWRRADVPGGHRRGASGDRRAGRSPPGIAR